MIYLFGKSQLIEIIVIRLPEDSEEILLCVFKSSGNTEYMQHIAYIIRKLPNEWNTL